VLIKAEDLRVAYEGGALFDGLSLALRAGERVGLVGPNGGGKSTLLRILARRQDPDRGTVTHADGVRVGLLPQEALALDRPVADVVRSGLGEAGAVWTELDRTGWADGDLLHRFEALGGWTLQAQLEAALRRAGAEHIDDERPFGTLSGGEAARVLLAALYAGRPGVLLLDEPTNHLDLDGLEMLEDGLAAFDGAVLVVSHDRRFLDETVDRILELEHTALHTYDGGYTDYRAEKRRRREKLELQIEAQRKRRARAQADVAALRQAARASERKASGLGSDTVKRRAKLLHRKAQSRERRLSREMSSERWRRLPREHRPLKPTFAADDDAGRLVARLTGVHARVLRDIDLVLHARERVALVGPNGAGKSTLLALLDGTLAPAAGEVDVRVATRLLPQRPVGLPLERTLWSWFREAVPGPEDKARTLLAHFRFDETALRRPLARLSPGERSRAHVAAMVGAEAPMLLLDEPTNHLDFDTLDTLESALRSYDGTIVAVSHDRAFLDAIEVGRVLDVRDGQVGSLHAPRRG
jgi:ATPase subunit of ABC transporter with duplicated ATPase domains